MAEIGLAAAIITVIQISASVGKLAYTYGEDVKNAKEDMNTIVNDMDDPQKTLNTLTELAKRAEEAKKQGYPIRNWETFISLNGPTGHLQECTMALESLRKQLELHVKSYFTERVMGRVKWPREKEKLHKSLDVIRKQKAAFLECIELDEM